MLMGAGFYSLPLILSRFCRDFYVFMYIAPPKRRGDFYIQKYFLRK